MVSALRGEYSVSNFNGNFILTLSQLTPATPLRHGHAISIDMAYSVTLANTRGLLSDEQHRRLLGLFSRAGLSMDHELFNEEILAKATAAILKTRDGLLRAAVPRPLGSCKFLNDVIDEEMAAALHRHKMLMKEYPRSGAGIEAYVDASDTGYTVNAEHSINGQKLSDGASGSKESVFRNGVMNGLKGLASNSHSTGLPALQGQR
jgi:3-dehydroquinate synthase